MEIVARHYRSQQPVRVLIEDGRYTSFTPIASAETQLPWIAPGLVDVQINGFGGIDLNRPLPGKPEWDQLTSSLLAHGCTHFLATLITAPRDTYQNLIRHVETHRSQESGNCRGYHFEGPFLNPDPDYRGAHQAEWMTAADASWVEEWIHDTSNSLRLITLAPEIQEAQALDLIKRFASNQFRFSAGHSALRGEPLRKAVDAGVSCWTHLGNAAPHTMHKFDNVLLHTLAEERLFASLIPDGLHLPPHAFRALARALGNRLILTTDAMAGAGAGPGSYTIANHEVEVGSDGRACVPGTSKLAGSTLTPFTGVFRATEMTGSPWEDMWDAFSIRPARWMGWDHDLVPGHEASFCLFETGTAPELKQTVLRGS